MYSPNRPFFTITGARSFGCSPSARTLASLRASTSTARFSPTASTSSSLSSEPKIAPIFTNGPNRPIPASIGSPSSGCVPTKRGSDNKPNACSSVIWSPSMPFGSEVRRGLTFLSSGSASPCCTYSPYGPRRTVTICPPSGFGPSSRRPSFRVSPSPSPPSIARRRVYWHPG